MAHKPHEVMIFTVEEVLLDIYDGELHSIDTEVATIAFGKWLFEHNAHYYTSTGSDTLFKAVLGAIQLSKHIVVLNASALVSKAPDDDGLGREEIDEQ